MYLTLLNSNRHAPHINYLASHYEIHVEKILMTVTKGFPFGGQAVSPVWGTNDVIILYTRSND